MKWWHSVLIVLVLPVAVKTLHPRNQLMREWVWFCWWCLRGKSLSQWEDTASSARHCSRNPNVDGHIFNHKQDTKRATVKWGEALSSQSLLLATHFPQQGCTYSTSTNNTHQLGCSRVESMGNIPIKTTTSAAQLPTASVQSWTWPWTSRGGKKSFSMTLLYSRAWPRFTRIPSQPSLCWIFRASHTLSNASVPGL